MKWMESVISMLFTPTTDFPMRSADRLFMKIVAAKPQRFHQVGPWTFLFMPRGAGFSVFGLSGEEFRCGLVAGDVERILATARDDARFMEHFATALRRAIQ